MIGARFIPVLLLDEDGLLTKTVRFGRGRYIGDPINAVRIFNDKGVDELFVLDIAAARKRSRPRFELLKDIASEAFMPVGYGGGLSNIDDIRAVLRLGIEKVVLSTAAFESPALIADASSRFGAQAVVASVDYGNDWLGRPRVRLRGGAKTINLTPDQAAAQAVQAGAGEIFLMSIDRDGLMQGYDLETLRRVAQSVPVPVVAGGGAGNIEHVRAALEAGASAAAGGSIFVYYGRRRAVLINVPEVFETGLGA